MCGDFALPARTIVDAGVNLALHRATADVAIFYGDSVRFRSARGRRSGGQGSIQQGHLATLDTARRTTALHIHAVPNRGAMKLPRRL